LIFLVIVSFPLLFEVQSVGFALLASATLRVAYATLRVYCATLRVRFALTLAHATLRVGFATLRGQEILRWLLKESDSLAKRVSFHYSRILRALRNLLQGHVNDMRVLERAARPP
jgi:hypothetical protein